MNRLPYMDNLTEHIDVINPYSKGSITSRELLMKDTISHDTPLILTATIHATIAHRTQFRKGTDIPYVTHPLQVARTLAKESNYPVTSELIAAAILHDVVEDTSYDVESFPEPVRKIVHLLSDPSGGEIDHRREAIIRIQNEPDAIMVKMADRFCNLDEKNDYREKYHAKPSVRESTRALLMIAQESGLDETDIYQNLKKIVKEWE